MPNILQEGTEHTYFEQPGHCRKCRNKNGTNELAAKISYHLKKNK